jgi:ankyrin repeat protein
MRVTYRTQAGLPIRISHPTIDQAKELLSRIGLQDPRTRLLMWHAGYDHVTELRQLMDQGVFVDVRGTGGGTALRVAAAAGAMRSLEFLIEAGARVDGSLALAAAASRGRLLAVRLLLAHGGNADERHHESVLTALMCASSEGNVEIVRELLLAGASVDLRDEFERTALMLAATNGHTEVVDLLLAEGANVNARDMAGRRAVDLVPPYHQAVMQLLVRSGARRGPAPLRILSCLPCSVFGGR